VGSGVPIRPPTGNTDSESNFEGSYRSLRECNMLPLSKDGVVPGEDAEDDAYPIPRTLGNMSSTTRNA
jgi:hypothetical protein